MIKNKIEIKINTTAKNSYKLLKIVKMVVKNIRFIN